MEIDAVEFMEYEIKIKWPMVKNKYVPKPFFFGHARVSEFGGKRINHTHHLFLFGWCVASLYRNEYHDRSQEERANEYLEKWSDCEKELRGLRLLLLGNECNADVKKLIRDSLGVDLDEGRVI